MNILYLIYQVLSTLIQAYSTLIIIYILMSWFPGAYQTKIGQIIVRLCEPYLGFFRRFIPPIGMISFSGIAAIVVLSLAERGLFSIYQLLARLILGF
jgi:YggT family protein